MRYLPRVRGAPQTALAVTTLATFTDMLLYGLVVPVLPGYADDLGIDEWAIGVLVASYSVALLVGTPIFGALSDRVGRKGPMLYGLIGLAAATALFAFAENFPMLLIARLLQGVAAAATWTAGLALVADVYPSQSRGAAMGTALTGMTAGMLIGPPLGGLLYEWGGYRAPFVVAGAATLILAVAILVLLRDPPRLADEGVSLRALLGDRTMQIIAGATIVAAAAWGLLEPTLPLRLEEEYGVGAGGVGLLFGAATLVYGIVSPMAGMLSDRVGRRPALVAGTILIALSLPLIGVPGPLALLVAGLMIVSVGYGLMLTPVLPEMAEVVDRRGGGGYAAAYAVFNGAYGVGMTAGPVIGGALASLLSFPLSMLVAGILVLAYLPALGIAGRKSHVAGAQPPSPSPDPGRGTR